MHLSCKPKFHSHFLLDSFMLCMLICQICRKSFSQISKFFCTCCSRIVIILYQHSYFCTLICTFDVGVQGKVPIERWLFTREPKDNLLYFYSLLSNQSSVFFYQCHSLTHLCCSDLTDVTFVDEDGCSMPILASSNDG